jgi:hypothetical protein
LSSHSCLKAVSFSFTDIWYLYIFMGYGIILWYIGAMCNDQISIISISISSNIAIFIFWKPLNSSL